MKLHDWPINVKYQIFPHHVGIRITRSSDRFDTDHIVNNSTFVNLLYVGTHGDIQYSAVY